MAQSSDYPVQLSIDYPERLNRWLIFVKWLLVIPHILVIAVLGIIAGVATIVAWFAILFTGRFPRSLFDFILGFTWWYQRANAYGALMRDEYPPFQLGPSDHPVVHVRIEYPEGLNRWLIFVKWLLAIPHYIVLYFLGIITVILALLAWFAILFTTRYPRSIFDFNLGVMRWNLRVNAYVLLMTDKYPPFRLNP